MNMKEEITKRSALKEGPAFGTLGKRDRLEDSNLDDEKIMKHRRSATVVVDDEDDGKRPDEGDVKVWLLSRNRNSTKNNIDDEMSFYVFLISVLQDQQNRSAQRYICEQERREDRKIR